ncbi:GlsB/YeaQ/YmgE family stress response membrane protein [Rhodovulum adriaticum]|uniref:Transglycosylase associated protein n=1 Tax=Rhodovulum adriaticum TaxID=35804 RepID=A0A4V2SKZ1_RHOAD|nr:GlsB/YeaQ/YmgE family stress response membrane protein [Rhodovulum adriaticum]MBK1635884.1 GlsB/YeaQ/YmgE family stress response membrane protein [Rhodovulum adriaticum]TCP21426.1 transglycosylase associated protein [Rhodovulum adriaticum]
MSILFLVIVGIAAGFLATRLLRVEADIPTTIAIGIAGALIGGLVLRLLLALTGFAAGLLGAVLGAMALLWAWEALRRR